MEPQSSYTEPLISGQRGGNYQQTKPIKRTVTLSERRFDVDSLPADMRRVYGHLEENFGEEYGLLFVFTMRTAVELHRAWNMTLLTSTIMQQIKDEFGLRMTWNLGVVRLKFRVEDGGFELHRKVPYDYDSEYQDIYYRIALALIGRKITVHEALLYQTEAKSGVHTAGTGRFLRDFPGRLVLYPLQASMCAVIFFGGKWIDVGVAAVCGLAAGLVDWILSYIGGQAKLLTDVIVGICTGIIGGVWYIYVGPCCLPAIFLGTLYWFFYGTAFVIGLLEIIVGELETGVTRFVAVSVKTFVLSLGASFGLMLAHLGGASVVWFESSKNQCSGDFPMGKWWRIPIYLLCCVGVLGQYRLQVDRYLWALVVQLVAYEVQYSVFHGLKESYYRDHLDTAVSNVAGAVGGVISALAVSWAMNMCRKFYSAKLLKDDKSKNSKLANFIYWFMQLIVKMNSCLGASRKSEIKKLIMEKTLLAQHKELSDPSHPRDRIDLPREEEDAVLETIMDAQDINTWSILMPAVYQLVPGSVIARLWFHSIFPQISSENDAEDQDSLEDDSEDKDSVFSALMVISTSLALGLMFGFALAQSCQYVFGQASQSCNSNKVNDESTAIRKHRMTPMQGMYTAMLGQGDDPKSFDESNHTKPSVDILLQSDF